LTRTKPSCKILNCNRLFRTGKPEAIRGRKAEGTLEVGQVAGRETSMERS
jgi:hypothetical protein